MIINYLTNLSIQTSHAFDKDRVRAWGQVYPSLRKLGLNRKGLLWSFIPLRWYRADWSEGCAVSP